MNKQWLIKETKSLKDTYKKLEEELSDFWAKQYYRGKADAIDELIQIVEGEQQCKETKKN